MKLLFALASIVLLTSCSAQMRRSSLGKSGKQGLLRSPQSVEEKVHWDMVKIPGTADEVRAGYYLETGSMRGCVLFLEGFGDSIQNHLPLFEALSQAGFRTITYDYFGQGGSEGRMNSTRVVDPDAGGYEILFQAKFLWNKFSEEKDPILERNCARERKFIVGWSTGGLAAYALAKEGWPDAIAMIAPGIHPNKLVGAAASNIFRAVYKTVTLDTLTRNKFSDGNSPFLDPIKPDSPVFSPLFAKNLLSTAKDSQSWKIDRKVKGLVFLGGGDTYVDSHATAKTLFGNAVHIKQKQYPGAFHCLDNELPEVANDVREKIAQFFSKQ